MDIKWTSLRACVMVEQKNICAMCGKVLKDNEFTLHHIKPRAEGGKDELDNLIGLCNPCHDITEDKKLNREEINSYKKWVLSSTYKTLRKIYSDEPKKLEYDYPEEIILQEVYIIKPELTSKTIIVFEVDKEFKDRIFNACKNFKIDSISYQLTISQFVRMAINKLLNEVETEEGSKQ